MRRTILAVLAVFGLFLASGVFGQQQGGGPVQTATVTLTSAQLQHLHGTPVQLIAAPGAGQALFIQNVFYQYKAGGTPYTVVDGSFQLSEGASPYISNGTLNAPGASFIDQPTSQVTVVSYNSNYTFSQSAIENQALSIYNNSGSGTEWSGGNGTVTVTVYYAVITLQ